MPRRPEKRPARAPRCSFSEAGRRCPFAGDGDPALCGPHRIAVEQAAKMTPRDVIASALNNFLQGKPINVEQTVGAAESFFRQWAMGGSVASGPFPGQMSQDDVDRAVHDDGRHAPPRRPAAHDPELAARAAKLARAKRAFGFGDSHFTAADVKERRKKLARKHHPDVGGDAAKMAKVNEYADILLASINAA